MPETYIVRQEGLSLDLVLWRRYGRRGQDLVARTLGSNVGLAALGPILPVGTKILLPDLPAETRGIVAQPVDLFG